MSTPEEDLEQLQQEIETLEAEEAALAQQPGPEGVTAKLWDRGPAIAHLQAALAAAGIRPQVSVKADGTWDGIFGPATMVAVSEAQLRLGTPISGYPDEALAKALGLDKTGS